MIHVPQYHVTGREGGGIPVEKKRSLPCKTGLESDRRDQKSEWVSDAFGGAAIQSQEVSLPKEAA